MIDVSYTIGGSKVTDSPNMRITKSQSELTSAGNFSMDFNNYAGYNADKYHIGDEVQIFASKDIIRTIGSPSVQFTFNTSGTYGLDNITGFSGLSASGASYSIGKFGSAIEFIGSPSVFLVSGVNPILSGMTNQVSFFSWIYPNIFTGVVAAGLFEKSWDHTNLQSGIEFSFNAAGSGLQLRIRPSGSSTGTVVSSATIPNAGRTMAWHHAGFTYDGIYERYYWDGVNIGSYNLVMSQILNSTSGTTFIGRRANNAAVYSFSGLMDDARFYNSALTSSQVLEIYNQSSGTETITNENQKVFTGLVEDITYEGEGINEKMLIEGRDYSARLMDRTVEPEVYTNLQPGSIVKDLIFKYTDNISTSGVQITGSTLARIAFNQVPVFDAVKQLADMSQNVFYVDNNKDLHFEPTGSVSSGYTFNNTNVAEGDFKEQRDTCFNQIWVYGDRYLDGYKETFTAGSPLGGSIINLIYKPHNTQVTVSGAIIQPGGIYNMNLSSPESGLKYLVDYEDSRIIFISGTLNGVNIPTSGNAVIIDYKRSLPIVKVGDNNSSQAQYGKRVKVIVDKNIKDPQTAEAIMLSNLDQLSEPQVEGNILIDGVADLIPGQTCIVDFPREGVNNETYNIAEVNFRIDKESLLRDRIITAKVSKKLPDLTDKIKQMMLDIKKLQGNDISDADLITRYQSATGSFAVRQSGCTIFYRGIGSAFILGQPINGLLGSYTNHNLGDWRTGSTLYWSGCYLT